MNKLQKFNKSIQSIKIEESLYERFSKVNVRLALKLFKSIPDRLHVFYSTHVLQNEIDNMDLYSSDDLSIYVPKEFDITSIIYRVHDEGLYYKQLDSTMKYKEVFKIE